MWYVKKEITLLSNETMEVLVPQIYLCQASVNKLTHNTDEILKLQAELSIKQATDTAIQESTDAGNKAVQQALTKMDNQSKQEASIQAKNELNDAFNTYITNNQENYNQRLQDTINSLPQTKSVSTKLTSCSGSGRDKDCTTTTALKTQPKTPQELLNEATTQLNNQLKTELLASLEQQYYNEIKTSKLNDFTTPPTLIDDTGNTITLLSKQEQLYQDTYNNTYPASYNTALAKAEQQNKAKANTDTLIAGNDVIIQSLNPNQSSSFTNSGTIQGNRKVVITTDQINNSTSSIGGNQATITAGELVYLNTIQYKTDDNGNYLHDEAGNKIALSSGIINNNSGMLGATGIKDSNGNTIQGTGTTYIATGELNNTTLSQQENYSYHSKTSTYESTNTFIGATSQIATNGNLVIDTIAGIPLLPNTSTTSTGNLNLTGSSILAKGDIDLNIGGDLNSTTIQNYNREYNEHHEKGGLFGKSTDSIKETTSLKNLSSYITSLGTDNNNKESDNNINSNSTNNSNTSNGNITINATNLTSIGTQFSANGNLNLNAMENITLLNAMDYSYDYSYYKESKFDVAGALVSIGSAMAVGALTGGAGAVAMAGASATIGASQMQKGSVDVSMSYDETILQSNLTANNINITSGKNTTLISTNLNATNDLNITTTNGDLLVGTANERHESQESHTKFGGDLIKASIGGAITGLATGLGMQGGEMVGNYVGSAVGNSIGGTSAKFVGAATNGATKALTLSISNTFGSTASQMVINGETDLGKILDKSFKQTTSKEALKNYGISVLIGGVGGALGEYIKDVKSNYNNSLTEEQIKNHMGPVSVEESNLKNGSWSDNKIGVNSYYNSSGDLIEAGEKTKEVNYWASNQSPIFKTLNFLPGSPSFADFHDALNLPNTYGLNQLSIIPAYPISQFNALYLYYPVINQPKVQK